MSQVENAVAIYNGPDEPNKKEEETKDNFVKPTKKYSGLGNQGATCYMNSLLQSLFMTQEFRETMFKWQYNKEIHAKPEDCIPLQLQKVFAMLQLKFTPYVSTKDLTKSFQWEAGVSYEQQDVQEFCRVLFDAIEESMRDSPNENFIKDLYEGSTLSYVKCLECGFESQREENFLDLLMIVKNQFDQIYNDSLEKAMQIWLKPEQLDGSNQYHCDKCDKKVDAKKGVKLFRLPKLLSININRFAFDPIYLKRVKLDDYFSFPFILNMNNYINGYEGIKNKVSEEKNPDYFKDNQPINPNKKKVTPSSTATRKPGTNTSTKPSAKTSAKTQQTRSFISEIRKAKAQNQKDKQPQPITVEIYSKDEQQIRDSHIKEPPPLLEKNPIAEQFGESTDFSGIDMKEQEALMSSFTKQKSTDSTSKDADTTSTPPQKPSETESTAASETDKKDSSYQVKTGDKVDMNEVKSKIQAGGGADSEDAKQKAEDAKQKAEEAKKKFEQQAKERKDKIEEYLKDGPLVYELYSILIHSGGAYGGHYYAFIRSFEDGKWYTFNDMNVQEIEFEKLPSMCFGGGKMANAYMLMYRQVGSPGEQFSTVSDDLIPEDMKKELEEVAKQVQKFELEQYEKAKQLELKVYHILECKPIPTSYLEKFKDFEKRAIETYKIKEDPKNVRLRIYQPQNDILLDTFTGKGDKTLQELKIFSSKCFAIEIKKDGEEFEEFDVGSIFFKIAKWRQNLPSINEEALDPKKVFVHKDGTMQDLVNSVAKEFKLDPKVVKLVKKSQQAGFAHADLLSKKENHDKSFFDSRIFEGMMLYLEEEKNIENPTDESLVWKEEFERDAYRYVIKFNMPVQEMTDPTVDYGLSVVVDGRDSIQKLKEAICKELTLSEDKIILRRGGKHGNEIKDLNATLQGSNFVSGSSVFVEFGRPTKPGQFRLIVYLAELAPEKHEEICPYNYRELFEIIAGGEQTAKHVKDTIAQQAKETYGYDWDANKLRLREKAGDRLTKVYRNTAIKSQGVTDKKAIVVEVLDEDQVITPKEHLLVCRIWNPETAEFVKRFEICIDRNASLKRIGEKIMEKDQSIKLEDMMGTKLLGTYKFLNFDLLLHEWFPVDDEHNLAYSHPFYINADGGLMIIKDKNIKHMELSEEQRNQMGIIQRQSRVAGMGGYGGMGGGRGFQEKSLKIKVKKKEDYEKEEKEAAEKAKKAEEDKKDAETNNTSNTPKPKEELEPEENFEPFF